MKATYLFKCPNPTLIVEAVLSQNESKACVSCRCCGDLCPKFRDSLSDKYLCIVSWLQTLYHYSDNQAILR
jgi:hypothetical protein